MNHVFLFKQFCFCRKFNQKFECFIIHKFIIYDGNQPKKRAFLSQSFTHHPPKILSLFVNARFTRWGMVRTTVVRYQSYCQTECGTYLFRMPRGTLLMRFGEKHAIIVWFRDQFLFHHPNFFHLCRTLFLSYQFVLFMSGSLDVSHHAVLEDDEVSRSDFGSTGPSASRRRVYFSRHGERLDFIESEWRSCSEMPDDPPLSPRGEEQARALGARLKESGVTKVYASPFQRCVRTACLAAAGIGRDVQVHVEPAVCERLSVARYWKSKTGPLWQDLPSLVNQAGVVDGIQIINTEYEPLFDLSFNTDAYPECSAAFAIRCKQAVEHLIKNNLHNENILIVGHVSSVKGLLHALKPASFWKPIPCTQRYA